MKVLQSQRPGRMRAGILGCILLGLLSLLACSDSPPMPIRPGTPDKPPSKLQLEVRNLQLHGQITLLPVMEFEYLKAVALGQARPLACASVVVQELGHYQFQMMVKYDKDKCSFGKRVEEQISVDGIENWHWTKTETGDLVNLSFQSEALTISFRGPRGFRTEVQWSREYELVAEREPGSFRWVINHSNLTWKGDIIGRFESVDRYWQNDGHLALTFSNGKFQIDAGAFKTHYTRYTFVKGEAKGSEISSLLLSGEEGLSVGGCGWPLGSWTFAYGSPELPDPLSGTLSSTEEGLITSYEGGKPTPWISCQNNELPIISNLLNALDHIDPQLR